MKQDESSKKGRPRYRLISELSESRQPSSLKKQLNKAVELGTKGVAGSLTIGETQRLEELNVISTSWPHNTRSCACSSRGW
jgi:hypothetical protein